jgi:hypothetical protein
MNEFRRCLEELDVKAVMALWETISPGQRRPKNENEALIVLHYARTQANSVRFGLRAYSHRWLCERALPSGLPDDIKPMAERIHPQIVEAVGVSVKAMSAAGVPLAKAIERAMSDAVAEAYADGNRDSSFVKARMDEARARVMRG